MLRGKYQPIIPPLDPSNEADRSTIAERRLLVALLVRAVHDSRLPDPKVREDARDFLASESEREFGCKWILATLFPHDWERRFRQIREQLESDPAKIARFRFKAY